MIIGNRKFENYTYVFAIVNLTPDSFYAPSRNDEYSVLKTVERAVKDGAAVIDLGAQSTRPGHVEVSADIEISRLMRPLELIKRNFDIPVSVDTYFSKTAKAALEAGADMINDVWGLTHDKDMAATAARYGASVCIMHNAEKTLEGDIWLSSLGFPLLLGTSRKSMFGGNAEDRLEATLQSTRLAAENKILFVRVHDVKENAQAVREVYGRC